MRRRACAKTFTDFAYYRRMVCLSEIGNVYHLQTSCITSPANWFNGRMMLAALYVWKIRSSAYFGQQRLGCRWQSICSTAFFIHVNMEEQDRRKPCWPSMTSMLMFFMQCRALGRNEKKFATSEETAYPMSLAKMFATCIVLALINLGIKTPRGDDASIESYII